jgi:uncharacterized protein DUF5076
VSVHLPGELSPPPAAKTDPRAREIARIWAAHGEQHAVLVADAWGEDPGPWGILLVDLARHVARAHKQMYGRPETETLARIRELFDVEWETPTDEPRGSVV